MFKLETILLPTDGSEYSKTAMEYALQFTRKFRTSVKLLSVVDTMVLDRIKRHHYPPGAREDIERLMVEDCARTLREFYADNCDPDMDVECLVEKGDPGAVILDCARRVKADLIILGTQGATDSASAHVGHVTREVIDGARCPVLCVKHEERETLLFRDHQL